MSLLARFKNFYNASAENKTQTYVFLGFIVVPILGMSALLICVHIFLL
jgi:hypothetical protein